MKFTIVIGHPDPSEARLNRALANAYAQAAVADEHDVRVIDVAAMEFPILRTEQEFYRLLSALDWRRARVVQSLH